MKNETHNSRWHFIRHTFNHSCEIHDEHGCFGTVHRDHAPLVAAAPELLDALRKISDYIPCDTDYFKHCGALQNEARAAIAKAKGEA